MMRMEGEKTREKVVVEKPQEMVVDKRVIRANNNI